MFPWKCLSMDWLNWLTQSSQIPAFFTIETIWAPVSHGHLVQKSEPMQFKLWVLSTSHCPSLSILVLLQAAFTRDTSHILGTAATIIHRYPRISPYTSIPNPDLSRKQSNSFFTAVNPSNPAKLQDVVVQPLVSHSEAHGTLCKHGDKSLPAYVFLQTAVLSSSSLCILQLKNWDCKTIFDLKKF